MRNGESSVSGKPRARAVSIGLAILGLSVLAGCDQAASGPEGGMGSGSAGQSDDGAGEDGAGAGEEGNGQSAQESGTGGQPFDAFMSEGLGVIQHAITLQVADCLAADGFSQLSEIVPDEPDTPFDYLRVTPATFGPATEAAARERGLGGEARGERPALVSNDDSFDAAKEACEEEAWSELGPDAETTVASYYDLGNQLGSAFSAKLYADSEMQDLAREWLGCVADAGFPVDSVDGFLADGDPARFGVPLGTFKSESPGGTPDEEPGTVEFVHPSEGRRYVPTEEEVEVAFAGVRCREELGQIDETMRIAIDIQEEVLDEYEPQLLELNADLEQLVRRAAELVGS